MITRRGLFKLLPTIVIVPFLPKIMLAQAFAPEDLQDIMLRMSRERMANHLYNNDKEYWKLSGYSLEDYKNNTYLSRDKYDLEKVEQQYAEAKFELEKSPCPQIFTRRIR